MVNKKDPAKPAPEAVVPNCPRRGAARPAAAPASTRRDYDFVLAGSPFGFEDYEIGEKIDHVDGLTVEEAEHQLATRLYQNTAKVHFNQYASAQTPRGKRLIYGGVVISLARSLAFNGLANAAEILADQRRPATSTRCSPGDTVYAWSEVLDKADLGDGDRRAAPAPGRDQEPALRGLSRTRTRREHLPDVILDFDYWAAIPNRG